jgi:hypothetical protein
MKRCPRERERKDVLERGNKKNAFLPYEASNVVDYYLNSQHIAVDKFAIFI